MCMCVYVCVCRCELFIYLDIFRLLKILTQWKMSNNYNLNHPIADRLV